MIIHAVTIVDYNDSDHGVSRTVFVQHNTPVSALLRDSGYTKRAMPEVFEAVSSIQVDVDKDGNPIMADVVATYRNVPDLRTKIANGGLTFILRPRIPQPPGVDVPRVDPPAEPPKEPPAEPPVLPEPPVIEGLHGKL